MIRWAVAGAVVALVAGAGGRASADLEFADADHIDVTLQFVGNHALSSQQLTHAMLGELGLKGLLESDRRERGKLYVESAYLDHGFINERVEDPKVTVSTDGRKVTVTVKVQEGDQYRVKGIDVTGELMHTRADALRLLGAQDGQIFNRSQIAAGISRLNDELRNAGYAYAEVLPETTVDSAAKTLALAVPVKRGPLVHVTSVRLFGVAGPMAQKARAALAVHEGDLFSVTALDRSKQALQALGAFESVDIATSSATGKPDGIEVRFEFKPKAR